MKTQKCDYKQQKVCTCVAHDIEWNAHIQPVVTSFITFPHLYLVLVPSATSIFGKPQQNFSVSVMPLSFNADYQ